MRIRTQKSREGYLLVDHQASPGLPAEVARASGMDPALSGEGKVFESATLTCSHCKVTVIKSPLRTRDRAFCFACGHHYICDYCAAATKEPFYDHAPYEKQIEQILKSPAGADELGSSPKTLLLP